MTESGSKGEAVPGAGQDARAARRDRRVLIGLAAGAVLLVAALAAAGWAMVWIVALSD